MKFPEWSKERLMEFADAEPGGLMACSPEIFAELKEAAKTDPYVAEVLIQAGVDIKKPVKAEQPITVLDISGPEPRTTVYPRSKFEDHGKEEPK